jgi:hypothetical protein
MATRQKKVLCSDHVGCNTRWCNHRFEHRRTRVYQEERPGGRIGRSIVTCSEEWWCTSQNKMVKCVEREKSNDYMKRLGL